MQLRELPSGGQLSIHGNVVNMPSNVSSTVSILPRPINESETIPMKRKLTYKHHYQFQNIRPTKVLKAAQYLVSTSDLFKNEGIQALDNYDVTNPGINEKEWSVFTLMVKIVMKISSSLWIAMFHAKPTQTI